MEKLQSSNSNRIINILNKVSLFEGLSDEEIKALYDENNEFYRTTYGEVFIREGEVESFFYILLSGKVIVYKNDDPSHVITKIEPGNFVGENSYFSNRPRSANVRANGECVLMRVDVESVRNMQCDVKDKVTDQIILELMQRVSRMNDSQLDLVNEARLAQKKIEELEQQMKRIQEEYPHIRTRFN